MMKVVVIFFVAFCLCTTVVSAQTSTKKKVYVSRSLEYLELVSDSTLYTSIGDEHDTALYYIKADTLFIRKEFWRTGKNYQTERILEWQHYKMVKQNEDSIFLLNPCSRYNWEDTLQFVSLPKHKETISTFRYLKLTCINPLDGTFTFFIDSLGKVLYKRMPGMITGNKKTILVKGELTKAAFAGFLDSLVCSLPSRFPKLRGCSMDQAKTDVEIAFNGKTVVSRGCQLKWTQAFLFNYLYDMNRNKGFIKRQTITQ